MSKTIILAITNDNKFIFVIPANSLVNYISSINEQIFIIREEIHKSISKFQFYSKQYDDLWKRSMDLYMLEKKLNDKYQKILINKPSYYL